MQTLAAPARFEQEIKKSRFIALACRVDQPEEAMRWLEAQRQDDASHNCWAWRIDQAYRFHDDGEPASTAGRPIHAAIEGSGLDHVVVMVIRYYGGTKLGAGGLARAYGGSASMCLNQAQTVTVIERRQLQLNVPFDCLGVVYTLLDRFDIDRGDEQYQAEGLSLPVAVRVDQFEDLQRQLIDATRGEIHFTVSSTPGRDDA